ncbi:VOC family protein [Streptomyces sp. FXJ1.172]|jgi:lactoylglutathione lyase|uniref:VOC family protein n=1 Tax=Streptomyces sp. FXJ1.172 TaxID=710705 RepID=UPI0007CFE1BA|nr:VOC family protein [Streptomyces sp. FXJ1.172]WEO97411.1 VOC family protein [Streptomyces sp. FXJ1.172]
MTPRIAHTGLNVTDLDRSLAFYRDVLGFALLVEGKEGDQRWAMLGEAGGAPLVTLWQQAQGAYDSGRPGLHHLAFTVDSAERVREYEAALREYGAKFAHEGVVAHREGGTSGGIFFHDPDGIRLEISAPLGPDGAPAPHDSAPTCGFF